MQLSDIVNMSYEVLYKPLNKVVQNIKLMSIKIDIYLGNSEEKTFIYKYVSDVIPRVFTPLIEASFTPD